MKKAVLAILATMLVPLASGCDEETPAQTGDLQVTYRVGSGSTTCEDEDIAFVRVYIDVSDTETMVDQITPCDPEDQSVLFEDVPVGTYTIRAEGLNAGNNVIYNGVASSETTLEADTTNGPVNVVLNQIPPAIQVFFDFVEPGNCDSFGVTEIRVKVYETGGASQFDQVYDCAAVMADSVLVADLTEGRTYDVLVRGTNDNDEYSFEFNEFEIEVAPGIPSVIEAELEACSGICTEP